MVRQSAGNRIATLILLAMVTLGGTHAKADDASDDAAYVEAKLKARAAEASALDTKGSDIAIKAEMQRLNKKFADLSFGVGIGLTGDLGRRDRISDAVVDVNGVVRVNKKNNVQTRALLESHYFFCARDCENGVELARVGWGPVVAVQPGEGEIIDALGVGFMVGLRRPKSRAGQSFNITLGAIVDPSVKVLGDEFAENRPAPVDATGAPLPIRFQERDQWGWMMMFSFSWGEGDD